MSTGNFHKREAEYYYVPKGWKYGMDDIDSQQWYDDVVNITIPDIVNDLQGIFLDYERNGLVIAVSVFNSKKWYDRDLWFATIYFEWYDDNNVLSDIAEVRLTFNTGYFEAGNLDYVVEISPENKKSLLYREMSLFLEKIDLIYTLYSDRYGLGGVSSSGETIYFKVDKKRRKKSEKKEIKK